VRSCEAARARGTALPHLTYEEERMTSKKPTVTKTKSKGGLVLRKGSYAAGKRATVATKHGYATCVVLEPVGVGPKGGIVFEVALRVAPSAGKVTFVPRGKETLVVDAHANPSAAAIQRLLRTSWGKKGGDPPTVVDHHPR
jgi:hypothetical protein